MKRIEHFSSVDELRGEVIRLIERIGQCNSLKQKHRETYEFFRQLLQRHPDGRRKKVALIVDLRIKPSEYSTRSRSSGYQNYTIFTVTPGIPPHEDSISWVKCLKGSTRLHEDTASAGAAEAQVENSERGAEATKLRRGERSVGGAGHGAGRVESSPGNAVEVRDGNSGHAVQSTKHHPGVVAATEWGKRYGKNLIPLSYSTPGHEWHKAKDKNWGAWSCCGGAVSSAPCQPQSTNNRIIRLCRPVSPLPAVVETGTDASPPGESDIPRTGVGAQIQFLIADKLLTTVVDEDHKTWKLNSGRVAKKKTEGTSWVWASDVKADGAEATKLRRGERSVGGRAGRGAGRVESSAGTAVEARDGNSAGRSAEAAKLRRGAQRSVGGVGRGAGRVGHSPGTGGGAGAGPVGPSQDRAPAVRAVPITVNQSLSACPTRSAPEISSDVTQFWKLVQSRLQTNKSGSVPLTIEKSEDRRLWFQCWDAAAQGAGSDYLVAALPIALLKLPGSAVAIPPSESVVSVLVRLVSADAGQRPVERVPLLEASADIVRDRLMSHAQRIWDPAQLAVGVRSLISAQRAAIVAALNRAPELTDRLARLLSRLSEMEAYCSALLSSAASRSDGGPSAAVYESDGSGGQAAAEQPWLLWRDRPTVGWLMSMEWHEVMELRSVYSDSDEYADVLLRLWTLLTFYWGSGALMPRCHQRQGGPGGGFGGAAEDAMICGEPMSVAAPQGRACSRCRGGEAVLRCHRHNHDNICGACFRRGQEQLSGRPSPAASTDVYDGVVERDAARRDGSVFLVTALQSRKPPRIAPNWRSTYRLNASALVAVVRLGVSQEPLRRAMPLQWAEIVPYDAQGGPADDWQARARGNIALRLLNRGDCSAMPFDADTPLDPGTRVAIIDLRVFVPEVVSVLGTFAQDGFKQHLRSIPFVDALIGKAASHKSTDFLCVPPGAAVSVGGLDARALIVAAVQGSDIELLQRLSVEQREVLAVRICALPQVKLLRGTQLEAFLMALSCAVHCTQGPPGTGKSFVGVALVLALVLIRNFAASAGLPVGPVLMLSYKNHALDEFLEDVLKYAPTMRPGELVRCGKPESVALAGFSERGSQAERTASEVLQRAITVVRGALRVVKQWKNFADWLDAAAETGLSFSEIPGLYPAIAQALLLSAMVDGAKTRADVDPGKEAFDLVTSTLQRADDPQQANRLSAMLPALVAGAEHWHQLKNGSNEEPILLWLRAWVVGQSPPPRCVARVDGKLCFETARNGSPLCELFHVCMATGCNELRLGGRVKFCNLHRCKGSIDNESSKLEDEQQGQACEGELFRDYPFCMDHCCSACMEISSQSPALVRAKTGPYACDEHRCRSGRCLKSQLVPHWFCELHCCRMCALTGSIINMPLSRGNSLLCSVHECHYENCAAPKHGFFEFCERHKCRLCDAGVDEALPYSLFCEDHRCAYPDRACELKRIDRSRYCLAHTCRVCLDLGEEGSHRAVTQEPPRNSCAEHRLCAYVSARGGLCHVLAALPSLNCEKHREVHKAEKRVPKSIKPVVRGDGSCYGLTRRNKRCKEKGKKQDGGRFYCRAHADQAEGAEDVDVEEEEEEEEGGAGEEKVGVGAEAAGQINKLLRHDSGYFTFPDIFRACSGIVRPGENCSARRLVLASAESVDAEVWYCAIHREPVPTPPIPCGGNAGGDSDLSFSKFEARPHGAEVSGMHEGAVPNLAAESARKPVSKGASDVANVSDQSSQQRIANAAVDYISDGVRSLVLSHFEKLVPKPKASGGAGAQDDDEAKFDYADGACVRVLPTCATRGYTHARPKSELLDHV